MKTLSVVFFCTNLLMAALEVALIIVGSHGHIRIKYWGYEELGTFLYASIPLAAAYQFLVRTMKGPARFDGARGLISIALLALHALGTAVVSYLFFTWEYSFGLLIVIFPFQLICAIIGMIVFVNDAHAVANRTVANRHTRNPGGRRP